MKILSQLVGIHTISHETSTTDSWHIPTPPATHHPWPHLILNNLSNWILAAGHQLTKAYHDQHPQNTGPKMKSGGGWQVGLEYVRNQWWRFHGILYVQWAKKLIDKGSNSACGSNYSPENKAKPVGIFGSKARYPVLCCTKWQTFTFLCWFNIDFRMGPTQPISFFAWNRLQEPPLCACGSSGRQLQHWFLMDDQEYMHWGLKLGPHTSLQSKFMWEGVFAHESPETLQWQLSSLIQAPIV